MSVKNKVTSIINVLKKRELNSVEKELENQEKLERKFDAWRGGGRKLESV